MTTEIILDSVLGTVEDNTSDPKLFLDVQKKAAKSFKRALKLLYDFQKKELDIKIESLPELQIDGFDEEQIWQQIDLENQEFIPIITAQISKLLVKKELSQPIESSEDESMEKVEAESDGEMSCSEAESQDLPLKKAHKKRQNDKFFKMEELDKFLNDEDKKESKGVNKKNDSDDESVDLFNDPSDMDDDEEEQNARLIKYSDFFDSPESDGETEVKRKRRRPSSEDEEELQNVKSTFEERQQRLEKKIHQLEGEAMGEKPWQLKGEVSANHRPQNSLLEDFVEVDVVSRPPPVMTEKTTLKLEDIIRQRLKDKAWDNVERKMKPVDTPVEYKKKLIMDQEKSKLSLAEIYEKEYVKQKEALIPGEKTDEPEPKEHIEIREKIHSIFKKLDALSNLHYTPRPVKPELKIISNIPAINMEEVAPIGISDATLLAPEEVQPKQRGDLLGKAERSKTDMKRELRKKKKKQREVHQDREKKEKLRTDLDLRKKRTKGSAKAVEKLTKSRNILKMDEQDQKATKSSTAFFNQLQDDVQSKIKASIKKPVKKDKARVSAVKLKL